MCTKSEVSEKKSDDDGPAAECPEEDEATSIGEKIYIRDRTG